MNFRVNQIVEVPWRYDKASTVMTAVKLEEHQPGNFFVYKTALFCVRQTCNCFIQFFPLAKNLIKTGPLTASSNVK